MDTLEHWIERQYARAIDGMLASISAVSIVKERPGLTQRVRPHKGSIVASPVLGAYDPEPDYFFHWYRDSALVLDALRLLLRDPRLSERAREHFADFVQFSLALGALDGRAVLASRWRERVSSDFARFVREDAELAAVSGANVPAETRVNPDGTLDLLSWPRPQHDGPALRALTVSRWLREADLAPGVQGAARTLLEADLEFIRAVWRRPCFDIWEEEKGQHYYTLRVTAAALEEAAASLEIHGAAGIARDCRAEAREILALLDGYWLPVEGFYRSRILESGNRSAKELDVSVVLATVHADSRDPRHSPQDPKIHATLACLESLFDAEYAINHGRAPGRGPALGRYANDTYYSGGAYYMATLGAAELCFRARGPADADTLRARGDAYLETVRAFTPPSGELSEQFDQRTGAQTSARHLAWSYAAFISCVTARRDATPRDRPRSA